MKKYLVLAIFSILSFSARTTVAEVRYYDVELIIFENFDEKDRLSENWPTSVDQTLPESEKMIEIGRPYPGRIPREYKSSYTFKPLSRKHYQLGAAARRIEKSAHRRVLLHTAWRQPGMSWEEAINVHIKKTIPAASEDASNSALANETGELEGYIKVILSRYLHVDADIAFRAQPQSTDVFDFSEEAKEPVVYRLKQLRRRIRSTELHYLDNPVLGMLITMRPVETGKL